ncbi:MAG: regulatory protein RecX [Geodermatophilaceae bacterium]
MARLICLRLLTNAPRTRAQLAAALHRRGVPDPAAKAVLDRFGDVGLIDDRAFAEAWVSSRHSGRGLAGRALSQELRQRGVDRQTTAAAVGRLDTDTERETARRLVRRRAQRLRGAAPDVALRRLVSMLARKGYSPGLAYTVVRAELAESNAVDVAALSELDESEPD